jgi:hypothetical protein
MLEVLKRIVSSDAFVQVVVAIVAAVWALPRISVWRQSAAQSKWSKLMDLAENAVVQTWNAYTGALKAERGAKLTPDQAAWARKAAADTLRRLADQELPGVITAYGQDAVEALVALVHSKLQKEGAVG